MICMRNLLYIALTMLLSSSIYGQSKKYAIVTIEKNINESIHTSQTDYWIVDLSSWEDESQEAILPLYLEGFSATDYKECCSNKNLILFNATSNESFDYEKGVLDSQKKLMQIIADKRKKAQTIKNKWSSGKREVIKVYLTPVTGNFCFCELTHKDNNAKIGYEGQILVPVSDFSYEPNFWESKLASGIQKFDFGELLFLSLQTIQ